MDGKPAGGLRWGELFLGLGFLFANVAAAFIPGRGDAQFYVRFGLAWMSFAAFVGLSALLVLIVRKPRALWHVAVSVVILTGIALSLHGQHFFASSGMRNWLFNLAAIVGLVACVRANRGFPDSVRLLAVPVTVLALCEALFWTLLSPCQIFLPVLFFPESSLAAAQAVFVRVFLSGAAIAFLACAEGAFCLARRPPRLGPPGLFETPVSRRAGIRMIVGGTLMVAIVVTVLYFLPGTSSGGGGAFVEYSLRNGRGEPRITVEEVSRYLREKGFQPSESKDAEMRLDASEEPVSWFDYPLSGSRDLHACLVRRKDDGGALFIYFRYRGASAFEVGRARRMLAAIQQHFRDVWAASHHPAAR